MTPIQNEALVFKGTVMGEFASRPKGYPSQPRAGAKAAAKASQPSRDAARQSNLIQVLIEARQAEHRSVPNLARMANVSPGAIKALESGKGPVATLIAIMAALPFQIAGLAIGSTFAEQLQNRRKKMNISVEALAAKASISPRAIVDLENGAGTVRNLLRLLAVIAPKVRRSAPERAHWGLSKKASRDSRFTPPTLMEPIYDAFGDIDLDPCGHLSSPVVAKRRFLLANGDDGLADPWAGRLAFVNPPFSQQLDWIRRAHNQWESGNVKRVVCLVPTRTDSEFFHDIVTVAADVYLLQGRLKFLSETGKVQATPFSLMLIVFGATVRQKARFAALVPGCWVSVIGKAPIATVDSVAIGPASSPHRDGAQPVSYSWEIGSSDCNPRQTTVRVCCGPE